MNFKSNKPKHLHADRLTDPCNNGFTLVELMVTVSVAAILTAIAIPAFNNFVLNDRDIGEINSLVASLNYAKSEAVKRASPTGVKVCPSVNAMSCSGGTVWKNGWIVLDMASAKVLQTVPALSGSNTVTPRGPAQAGIVFQSSGMASPVGAAPALQINVCDTRGAAQARDVEVNNTGRVASSLTPGQTAAGVALTCP